MYPCSADFHTAVANGNPQKALLIFSDCVFTNDDINIENGISFSDNFNLETDLAIGQTPSNEITFSLFNDDRLLNDYAFGEFTATIGVRLSTTAYTQQEGAVICDGQSGTYLASASRPYLKKNGSNVSTQPTKRITAMLAYGGKLYCFGNNYAIVYNESDMSVADVTVNAFMKKKANKYWDGKGMSYANRILTEWQDGISSVWEFVPLGIFNAERPKAPNVIEIDFTCYDRMQKFEQDMPGASALGVTYPTTINNLFVKMCEYAGVPYDLTGFTVNYGTDVTKEPENFSSSTMRTVLGWIAEVAASNLRFNRDGTLIFDWLRTTSQSIDESGYTEFLPYWYETEQVSKLYNRDTASGTDGTVGTGSGGYLIQDNPFLKGVS